jgi:nitrite reductase (NO-forming)
MNAKPGNSNDYSLWADTAAGAIRTAFGLVWAMDAYLKWQPVFFKDYLSYITSIANGQPPWLLPWFNFWISLIKPDPNLFAWLTRLVETAIAVGLLLGVARKWTYILGGVFAFFVWSIPEGFGGPYVPGATDVGAGLIYILVFVSLLVMDHVLGRSPYSLDYYLEKIFPAWRHLAEWAPPQILDQEPRRLSWTIQIVTIIGIVIMLLVFLVIIGSELNAAATQANIPKGIQMVFSLTSFCKIT